MAVSYPDKVVDCPGFLPVTLSRRGFTAGAAAMGLATVRSANAQGTGPIRIAVMTDQNSVYSATGGAGTIAAVKLAVEDMRGTAAGQPIEVLTYDHQNKTDIGLALAIQAYDRDNVDAIFDIGNSAISLAVQEAARQRGKIVVHVGSAHDGLYGRSCSPTGALWTYDTYSLAHGLTKSIFGQGGRSWFFITADYAFGAAMQTEATRVLQELGGTVLGSVRHPVGVADFSSYLLRARASGATTIALANASGDTVNAVKQAFEFGVGQDKQGLAVLLFYLSAVKELGAQARGLRYLESWYWDMDDQSRALARRYAAVRNGAMPNQVQAGNYSAVLHYLRSVDATNSRDGFTVMRRMKAVPVNDAYCRNTPLRSDGRLMKDYYLAEVKAPEDRQGPWDLLRIKETVHAGDVIRPLREGGCTYLDPA
jgi:branched-chain amino acid transport system substrate-binding protein